MLQIIFYMLFLCLSITTECASHNSPLTMFPFNKVIIWGHKLHSHTHSFIHYGFYKAFKHLGFDTYWLDDSDDVRSFDFSNALFITEGQVDKNIPLRDDCRYILHYCRDSKYDELQQKGNCIRLYTYLHASEDPNYLVHFAALNSPTQRNKKDLHKIDDCIYSSLCEQTIYMPWATDLLPAEIEEIKKEMPKMLKKRSITKDAYFIGTVNQGTIWSNYNEVTPFAHACAHNNIELRIDGGYSTGNGPNVDNADAIAMIQQSYVAPALQGKWQVDHGYIPCRIFKNISYGQLGITNSKAVYDLFQGKIVYNPDTYQLFYDAKKRLETLDINELYELIDVIKNKHTYINRISSLLEFMHTVKPI